jgi:hypothetical protein
MGPHPRGAFGTEPERTAFVLLAPAKSFPNLGEAAIKEGVKDTGAQLFMAGTQYYRQIDDLAMSLCVARKITDRHWREFLDGSFGLSQQLGHYANVTIASFVHAYPSPLQRRMTVEFLKNNEVRTVDRMALVSDSKFVRGAIVALNWIIPKAKVRSFPSRDVLGCFNWLREVAEFDVQFAADAWSEGRKQLGIE